jgi:thioredoxin-related protein
MTMLKWSSEPKQNACRYCANLKAVAKLDGTTPLPDITRPKRMCNYGKNHFCLVHVVLYHSETHLIGRESCECMAA